MARLGIDLGGTYARAAVVDDHGRILSATKVVLTDRAPEPVVEALVSAARSAVAEAGVAIQGCGVGAAGQIHGESGVLAVAPNLGWRNVPLGAMLATRLGHRVRVVNDLSAAAWGEFNVGAGVGVRDLFVVFVGSGVGSAIIANGQLVTGAGGVAAEFGHIKVVPDGRLCGCGEKGCLEAYAGGHNLIAQGRELLLGQEAPELHRLTRGDPLQVTPATLEKAALLGDPAAEGVYRRASEVLGLSLANQVTVLNPARVILGGGVLRHTQKLRAMLEEAIFRFASVTARQDLTVVDAQLGDDSGLIGAALLS